MAAFIPTTIPLRASLSPPSKSSQTPPPKPVQSPTPKPSLRQPTPPPKYNDGPLAFIMLHLLRTSLQSHLNWRSPQSGYRGFVEECRMLTVRFPSDRQQEIIDDVLHTIFFPPHGPSIFRQYFASAQLNATITPLFFQWLVGPCKTTTENGEFGVKIERCRFLEESGCKGTCINMCQQPTQRFFTDTLGLPLRMTPDYNDLSCEMKFGVQPLKAEEDPAINSECFGECALGGKRARRKDDACFIR